MGLSAIPGALAELAKSTTPTAQVAALRSLKNEIVGHEQCKELAVTHGIVKPLAELLRCDPRKGGKRRRNGASGQTQGYGSEIRPNVADWTTEDEVRFQATLIVGSLANGGPAFVTPLLQGHVLRLLLESLRPGETPSKLVTTTLNALNQIIDAVAQEHPRADMSDISSGKSLASIFNNAIYTTTAFIESLAEVLLQQAGTTRINQQIQSAIRLIMKTCSEKKHKKIIVEAGILDLLADKLAAIAVSDDRVPVTTEMKQLMRHHLPRSYLPDIMECLCAIIRDSHFYTARFLYSQSTQQLFGWPKEQPTTEYNATSIPSQAASWNKLIPRVHIMTNKSDPYTKSLLALGAYPSVTGDSYTRLPSIETLHQTSARSVITDESESPFFIWLMYVARSSEGRERLLACWFLALLKKFGDRWPLNDPSKITRERHFSYLIIPLVENMIEASNLTLDRVKKTNALGLVAWYDTRFVLDYAPLVLAELVIGNQSLQSTVSARTLPILVQILKKSFDVPAIPTKHLWHPRSSSQQVQASKIEPSSSTLGRPGLSVEMLHAFKYRESTLLALAALAGDQDPLRKLVIEMGAATHIIEALVPYSESSEQGATFSTKEGNPDAVIIAACNTIRSLSRSVSVLRTSLIDHGVAQPLCELLKHRSVKVQIAATEVITNLVLEVSPMRTEIFESGMLKTLCEQCHSANFDLRFGSLWALKHLCLGLTQSMKIRCLEELEVSWLVQVLNGEPSKPTMGTPNAMGEQVDILNAVEEPDMDVDDESSEEDENATAISESILMMQQHQHLRSRYTSQSNIRERLQQIKNDEQDSRLNCERESIRIQEQALDFIRNFVSEDKASGEMINHLLKTFGTSRFFELLDAKIRPKTSTGSFTTSSTQYNWSTSDNRASYSTNNPNQPNWAMYPSTELILATIFILVHFANGHPQHRSLLISQTTLMQHVLPLFTHPRREIRVACAWMLHNLVWVERQDDLEATCERATLLRQMGFEEGAKTLEKDVELDIRERAKTSVNQFEKLLDSGLRTVGLSGRVSQRFNGSGEGGGGGGTLGGVRRTGSGAQGGWGSENVG